jgi:histidinol-phosphate aminotransferase
LNFTRRGFLGALGTGTAAATVLQLPWTSRANASAEAAPVRRGASNIRLNSNENAYGPSRRVLQAIGDGVSNPHRYPDAARGDFEARVAQKHRVSTDQVLIGCGSVEILRVAAQAFTGPGRKLVMAAPTFEVIGQFAEAVGAEVVRVPLKPDFAHDLPAMLSSLGSDAGLVYICNPNNPTASLTPREELDAFISKLPPQAYVLVDEAYHHFAMESPDYVSLLDRPSTSDRVLVARTFSKVYGLAGLRLGYGIGSQEMIKRMRKLANPENANGAVLCAAMAALDDRDGTRASVQRNAADRVEFLRQAQRRKLSTIASHANFAMMDVGRPVPEVIEYFKKRGILVGRPFPPLNSHLRVSFGRPPEMAEFWRAWDQLPRPTG